MYLLPDLRDFHRYPDLVKEIDLVTNSSGLNVLFNNAGIAPKSTKITATKREDLMNTFETNTVAPIMLSQVWIYYVTLFFSHLRIPNHCFCSMLGLFATTEESRQGKCKL